MNTENTIITVMLRGFPSLFSLPTVITHLYPTTNKTWLCLRVGSRRLALFSGTIAGNTQGECGTKIFFSLLPFFPTRSPPEDPSGCTNNEWCEFTWTEKCSSSTSKYKYTYITDCSRSRWASVQDRVENCLPVSGVQEDTSPVTLSQRRIKISSVSGICSRMKLQ